MQASSTQGFNIYDEADGGGRGGGGGASFRRPGSASSKRPAKGSSSAGKPSSGRPQSASSSRAKLFSDPSQSGASGPQAETSANVYSQLSKESLMLELTQCKQRMRGLELSSAQQKAEIQRLENECHKQQGRIEKMLQLDPHSAGKNGAATQEARRELEKSMLVRQLKQQMAALRMQTSELEAEIESYKQSIKISNLSELTVEREEFYVETQRLRKLVKSLKEELAAERRGAMSAAAAQASGTGTGAGGGWGSSTEAELRAEIARLAAGYHDMLAGMGGGGQLGRGLGQATVELEGEDEEAEEAEEAELAASAAPKQAARGAEPVPLAQLRPHAPLQAAPPSPAAAPAPTPAPAPAPAPALAPGTRVEGQYKGGDRWYSARVKAALPDGTFHLIYDDGDEEKDTPAERVRRLAGEEDARPAPAQPPSSSSSSSSAAAPAGGGKKEAPKVQGKFAQGDRVEALYYSGETWYPATVQACLAAAGGVACYDLLYDDGDREKRVAEDKIRRVGAAEPAAASAAAPAAVTTAAAAAIAAPALKKPSSSSSSSSSRAGQAESIRDLDAPALAAHLRVLVREVLRGGEEFERAFVSMLAASAGGASQSPDAVSVSALTAFAEDVLSEAVSAEQGRGLYAQVDCDGDGSVTIGDFLRFLSGEANRNHTHAAGGSVPVAGASTTTTTAAASASASVSATTSTAAVSSSSRAPPAPRADEEEASVGWEEEEEEGAAPAAGFKGRAALGGSIGGEVDSEGSVGMGGLDAGPPVEVEGGMYEEDGFDDD